jgi:hypothetical protein
MMGDYAEAGESAFLETQRCPFGVQSAGDNVYRAVAIDVEMGVVEYVDGVLGRAAGLGIKIHHILWAAQPMGGFGIDFGFGDFGRAPSRKNNFGGVAVKVELDGSVDSLPSNIQGKIISGYSSGNAYDGFAWGRFFGLDQHPVEKERQIADHPNQR